MVRQESQSRRSQSCCHHRVTDRRPRTIECPSLCETAFRGIFALTPALEDKRSRLLRRTLWRYLVTGRGAIEPPGEALMATTTLRLSAARSRSRRMDRLRLVMFAVALPTLLLAVLVAAPLALAADPTAITVTAPTVPRARTRATALPVTWTTNQAVASGPVQHLGGLPRERLVRGQDPRRRRHRRPRQLRRRGRPERARRHRLPHLRLLPRHQR